MGLAMYDEYVKEIAEAFRALARGTLYEEVIAGEYKGGGAFARMIADLRRAQRRAGMVAIGMRPGVRTTPGFSSGEERVIMVLTLPVASMGSGVFVLIEGQLEFEWDPETESYRVTPWGELELPEIERGPGTRALMGKLGCLLLGSHDIVMGYVPNSKWAIDLSWDGDLWEGAQGTDLLAAVAEYETEPYSEEELEIGTVAYSYLRAARYFHLLSRANGWEAHLVLGEDEAPKVVFTRNQREALAALARMIQ